MQLISTFYKNLIIFLVSLALLNLAVGFYGSFNKSKQSKSSQVNYTIENMKFDDETSESKSVDYISKADEMLEIFKKYEFSVDSFLNDESANLIIFSSLPDDFMEIKSVNERKKLFINTLLPIIYSENLKILEDRKKILDWWNESQGENFSRDFWPSWLFELSEKYETSDSNLGNLLMKVDVIPISMALAQAAIESGWGTSRYLREGNAIYGQYTFEKDRGIRPERRESNEKFFIKRFSNLSESTRSYFKNINTHRAYVDFREERKKLRMNGIKLSGVKLVKFLTSYSERRDEYVKDVENVIQSNNFMKFDNSYLAN
jgi:Bax protein